jgi:hypothetical protein
MFIEAWTSRVEEMGVKCVVVFGHAASVIALGRAVRALRLLIHFFNHLPILGAVSSGRYTC